MRNRQINHLRNRVEDFEKYGFKPIGRSDLPSFPINIPFDWGIDPFKDNNWKFQLNTLRYLMIYADLFDRTKERKYIQRLLEYLKDWYEYTCKNNHEFAWQDMGTGIRSEKIGHVINILKVNNIQIPDWLNEMVIRHINKMREKGFINTRHNHGLYVIHGLRSLSVHVGPGMKKNILNLTRDSITELFKSQFDDNFVHKEHSPHYHHLVTETLERYLKTGLYDDISFLKECYDGAVENQKYLYLPDGREVPFGDTDGAIAITCNLSKTSCWSFFNKSGYFISNNTNGSYVALTNSFYSNVHKHNDNLSVIFGVKGKDIIIDPGKYKYSKDQVREKILSSSSHNVINMKNASWTAKDLVQPLTDFLVQKMSDCFVVENLVRFKYSFFEKNIVWNRKIINHDAGFIVVIDKVNESIKNLVTRFVIDPEQITNNKDLFTYQGNDFTYHAFVENNKKIIPTLFKCLEVPISKKYGDYQMTQQIEVDMNGNKIISIFLFNKEISVDKALSLILNQLQG